LHPGGSHPAIGPLAIVAQQSRNKRFPHCEHMTTPIAKTSAQFSLSQSDKGCRRPLDLLWWEHNIENDRVDCVESGILQHTSNVGISEPAAGIYSKKWTTPSSFCTTATTFPSKPSKSPPFVATNAPGSSSSPSSAVRPSRESTLADAISKAWALGILPAAFLWTCESGQPTLSGKGEVSEAHTQPASNLRFCTAQVSMSGDPIPCGMIPTSMP